MTLEADFLEFCRTHKRVALAGGPRCGKTTLSKLVTDRPVIGTDSYRGIPWEDIPGQMIRDIAGHKNFVVEGVMVARALRRGLTVDGVFYLTRAKVSRKKGQVVMAKGIAKVMRDWRAEFPLVPLHVE
jgi:hypothetical protein